MEIKYNRLVSYRGKNSGWRQSGLNITKGVDLIRFTPIHSRDGLGQCYLEIPKKNIEEPIQNLKELL